MKNPLIVLAVLFLSGFTVKADFKFGGEDYSPGWEATTNHSTTKEFFARNETTNNWKTMITFQAHPDAIKVKEVSGPYFDARNSILALPPKVHPKRPNDASDVVLELMLGAPGKTSHLEFALVRFVEAPSGVYVVAYSYRLPLSERKNQDINVDPVMKSRDKLIRELLEIPVDIIKDKF